MGVVVRRFSAIGAIAFSHDRIARDSVHVLALYRTFGLTRRWINWGRSDCACSRCRSVFAGSEGVQPLAGLHSRRQRALLKGLPNGKIAGMGIVLRSADV